MTSKLAAEEISKKKKENLSIDIKIQHYISQTSYFNLGRYFCHSFIKYVKGKKISPQLATDPQCQESPSIRSREDHASCTHFPSPSGDSLCP